jgi:hypothetical protein
VPLDEELDDAVGELVDEDVRELDDVALSDEDGDADDEAAEVPDALEEALAALEPEGVCEPVEVKEAVPDDEEENEPDRVPEGEAELDAVDEPDMLKRRCGGICGGA